jgi:predicted O-methyltransferase YrrM
MSRGLIRPHWTPRYVVDRARLAVHERRHPRDPWLTADAVRFLDGWLRPTDRCLEWGAGRSTAWFAARTASVVSIEHDQSWATKVSDQLAGVQGVSVHLIDGSEAGTYASAPDGAARFDVALVDGIHRDQCALAALDLVDAGGIVVVDNVERYLPSRSRSPEAIGDRYESEDWRAFEARTERWRRYWTSDGVTDTAIFFSS